MELHDFTYRKFVTKLLTSQMDKVDKMGYLITLGFILYIVFMG